MRIWGYAMLGVCALFAIFFFLAGMGGARLSFTPYFVLIAIASMGWTFSRYGGGLLRSKARASAATLDTSDVPTIELPMTPRIVAAVEQQRARVRRIVWIATVAVALFLAALGAVLDGSLGWSTQGRTILEIFIVTGAATALTIYGISWLSSLLPFDRDVRSKHFLRTVGPIRCVPIAGGTLLRLADRAFIMNGAKGMSAIGELASGTVEYSAHGHVLLAAWDDAGRNVYTFPGLDAP